MILGTREPIFCMPGTFESKSIEGTIVAREGERSIKDSYSY